MGRQVSYRSHPADLPDLDRYLLSVGGVVLSQPTQQREPVVFRSLDVDSMPPPANRFSALIARESDLSELRYRFYEVKGWVIEASNSPVLEYSPGYDAAGLPYQRADLRRGRMWFATTYLRDGQVVPADEGFVRWADRWLQWIRRNWSRVDSFVYESSTAAAMPDHERAELAGEPSDQVKAALSELDQRLGLA